MAKVKVNSEQIFWLFFSYLIKLCILLGAFLHPVAQWVFEMDYSMMKH